MTVQSSLGRRLLLGAAVGLLAGPVPRSLAQSKSVKAIAFDGFVIIDPRPVAMRAEELFPGQGARLMEVWRSRQFEYTWLRTLSRRYVDFRQVTQEALVFAATATKLDLTVEKRDRLMETFLELKAWPDVAPALRELKGKGIRMAFLANPTARMFDAVVRNSGLEGLLEEHLSTDRVQAYKPDPRAYQMGLDAFGLSREEIVFAASASWDAAGAKVFGYPTFWINRAGLPAEQLGATADAVGTGMVDLAKFVGA
ncbi:MAG: haloacid dehalogenase type II [Reyranella sp.]